MSVIHAIPQLLASGGDYLIKRSVRLRAAATAYFSRTPASAGSYQICTLSFWVKRGSLGSRQALFSWSGVSTANNHSIEFTAGDLIEIYAVGTAAAMDVQATQPFRDPTAWYHIVYSIDTTQATASNRVKLFVNGLQVTAFSIATYPAQNANLQINSTNAVNIGRRVDNTGAAVFDGYFAEINFIDGQALLPTSFGEFDAVRNTQWKPKAYTGTSRGTNGFYLPFTDNSTPSNLGVSAASTPETVTFWTAVGSAALDTTTKKFGAGSVYFPGGTSRLDGSATLLSDLNGIDWTIEGWINPTTLAATYIDIFGSNSAGQVSSVSIRTGSSTGYKLNMGDWGTTAFTNISSLTTLTTGTWTHFAITKSGTTLRMFINGTLEATVTSANTTFPSFTCSLGNRGNGDLPFNGYIDDLRITRGVCRYTASFTAPAAPYSLVGETNPVSMLMNFDSSITAGQRMVFFTPNGISLTAGATYDSMTDVPSLTGDMAANFAIANPINAASGLTLSDGNLKIAASASGSKFVNSSVPLPSSGAYYAEIIFANAAISSIGQTIGLALASRSLTAVNNAAGAYLFYASAAGALISNGTTTASSLATISANELFQVAVDVTNSKMWIGRNNVWYNSTGGTTGDPSTGANPTFTGAFADYFIYAGFDTASAVSANLNFGQRPFAFTPPSGFRALNAFNLPDGAVPSSDDYHKVYTYTGNGGGLQVGEIQKPASLFNLDRSIRIRAAVNAYFSRLPTVNGNGQKFTISTWIKRGKLGTGWTDTIFTGRTGTNFPELDIMFSTDLIKLQAYTTGAALLMNVDTVNLYRDTNMWYHVVTAFDTTQAVAADRVKVYVNGVTQTIAAGATYPSQNLVLNANQTVTQYIGSSPANTAWGDLYFADYYMIDGQQLTPDSFGQYDGNYYWTPKAYGGAYGANGFHLEFKDYSAATAAAIGKDTSGQGNNWTPNNINLTTPANTNSSWDSMVDVPTQTSTDVANFATLSPLSNGGGLLVDGNLIFNANGLTHYNCKATITIPRTGKWYWESKIETISSSRLGTGLMPISAATSGFLWATAPSVGFYEFGSGLAGFDAYGAQQFTVAVSTGAIVQFAYDADNGNLYAGINNVWYNASGATTGSPSTLTNPTATGISATNDLVPTVSAYSTGAVTLNFGQRPFRYTPPTGFKALNSFNVAEVLGDLESPDFVWIKSRSAATDHALFNSVVGAGKYVRSNSAGAEVADVNSLIQFNKNGILLGNSAVVNALAATFVASAWKIGGSVVTDNSGTISSQVRANKIAGISIATFTVPAAGTYSFGHGLGPNLSPAVVIYKPRDAVSGNIQVWHKSLGATDYLLLNGTALKATDASRFTGAPTNSVVSLGATLNGGGVTQQGMAICFAEIPGFSKFTSYAANASATDGPHVVCGFSPRWLMIKRATGASGTGGWIMYDTARNTYNTLNEYLFAEGAAGAGTLAAIDVTANGFKIRTNNVHINQTAGDIYIVMAFAEHPFKYALAR